VSEQRFAGRVVIVTGAATGIGAASARAFAREGAAVVVADVASAEGEATAASIRNAGGIASFRLTDVADEQAMRETVAETVAEHGRLDVMHANAAIEMMRKVADLTAAEWRRALDVNATGVFLACRYALIQMTTQRAGSIVITASPHALATVPDAAAYAASKGAVLALTRALALEGAPFGIRVNALLPGPIDTPMLRRESLLADDPEEQVRRFGASAPLNRLGTPDEVAAVAVFLASDVASYVTGAAVAVDGGLMAALPSGPPLSYGG
jgi:meso-butanediol dehydrogenase/(S,S)-butanediol dehydrogenase/diacetyl reductase